MFWCLHGLELLSSDASVAQRYPSDEDGDAWTFDYLVRVADRHRIGVELMRIHSERPSRASIGLPVRATEWIFQLSLRLQF